MDNKKFIAIWELIQKLNISGIFDYGKATKDDEGLIIINFENQGQEERYKKIFEEGSNEK